MIQWKIDEIKVEGWEIKSFIPQFSNVNLVFFYMYLMFKFLLELEFMHKRFLLRMTIYNTVTINLFMFTTKVK